MLSLDKSSFGEKFSVEVGYIFSWNIMAGEIIIGKFNVLFRNGGFDKYKNSEIQYVLNYDKDVCKSNSIKLESGDTFYKEVSEYLLKRMNEISELEAAYSKDIFTIVEVTKIDEIEPAYEIEFQIGNTEGTFLAFVDQNEERVWELRIDGKSCEYIEKTQLIRYSRWKNDLFDAIK